MQWQRLSELAHILSSHYRLWLMPVESASHCIECTDAPQTYAWLSINISHLTCRKWAYCLLQSFRFAVCTPLVYMATLPISPYANNTKPMHILKGWSTEHKEKISYQTSQP